MLSIQNTIIAAQELADHFNWAVFPVNPKTKTMSEALKCGCGRSPTGNCIGWHALSEEEYRKKETEYKAKKASK